MDANIEKLDDLIVCLVGMGFPLEDCQQAVQAGKLSVEVAVEWILAGKQPCAATTQGTKLKLTQKTSDSIGANPFTGAAPLPCQAPAGPQQSDSHPSDPRDQPGCSESVDEGVVSRCHMNEEQRRIKERFQEKQREEARKSAQLDKLAQKKAHELALKQIKEDRERQKLKMMAAQLSPTGTVSGKNPAPTSTATAIDQSQEQKTPTAMIQVRLPIGKAIKQSFDITSPLSVVWSWVKDSYKQAEGMALMQPFPHKDFTEADMSISLSDHGLTPSGSLVLRKQQVLANPEVHVAEENVIGNEEMVEFLGSSRGYEEVGQASSPGHQWGSGEPLVSGDQSSAADEAGRQGENMEVDDDSGEEEVGAMAMWQNAPLMPGHNAVQWQQAGPDQGQGWGYGQRLDGGWGEELPQHQAVKPKELAAEAAKKRYVSHPEVPACQAEAQCPVTFHRIPKLTDVIVDNITSRICDSRFPVYNLYGIPAQHTSMIMNALIRNGTLNTKTLQPFLSSNLTKLVLDSYPYTTNDLLSVVRLLKMLSHLSLANCPLITDKGLLLLKPLKRLKHLSLIGCSQITDKVFCLLKELSNLVTLSLEDTGITDQGLINYATCEPRPIKLENLNLSRTQITHNVLSALQHIPNLKSLSLEKTKFVSLAGINLLTKLESLNLANTMLVTDSLLCLKSHPSLRKLNISNTPQIKGDLALQYLQDLQLQIFLLPDRHTTSSEDLKYIKDMPLVELDLTNYINVDDVGAEYVAQISTLKRLRLCNTRITDVGLIYIQNLHRLEELLLQRTSVTDKGASVICGQNFPRLRELSLSQTLISNDYLLSGHLNSCIQLTKLNLSGTAISKKGIEALCLPYLELLNLDRTMIGPQFVAEIQNSARDAIPGCQRLIQVSCKNMRATTDDEDDNT